MAEVLEQPVTPTPPAGTTALPSGESVASPAPVAAPAVAQPPLAPPAPAPVEPAVPDAARPSATSGSDAAPAPEPVMPKTVLGEALAAQTAPAEAAKPAPEDKAAADEAPPVVYEDFQLPEGFKASPEDLALAKEAFGKDRLPQDRAQEYLNLHVKEIQKYAENLQKQQFETWKNTRLGWREGFFSDPEIGGNRADTTIKAANGLVVEYGTPELISVIEMTGIGDHPEFLRFLSRVAENRTEGYTRAVLPNNPAPPPAQNNRAQRRYSNMGNGSAGA